MAARSPTNAVNASCSASRLITCTFPRMPISVTTPSSRTNTTGISLPIANPISEMTHSLGTQLPFLSCAVLVRNATKEIRSRNVVSYCAIDLLRWIQISGPDITTIVAQKRRNDIPDPLIAVPKRIGEKNRGSRGADGRTICFRDLAFFVGHGLCFGTIPSGFCLNDLSR